jgi:hypothetical protein
MLSRQKLERLPNLVCRVTVENGEPQMFEDESRTLIPRSSSRDYLASICTKCFGTVGPVGSTRALENAQEAHICSAPPSSMRDENGIDQPVPVSS